MDSNWLSLVPVCAPFAYNAAFICEDCAARTIDKLQAKGIEDTGDSNDFPQGPYPDNESDSPEHCDNGEHCVNAVKIPGGKKIGCPLSSCLTEAGVAYIRNKIGEHILFGSPHQKGVGRLWWHLYQNAIDAEPLLRLITQPVPIPRQLRQALAPILPKKGKSTQIIAEIFTDLKYLYGGSFGNGEPPSLGLWRVPVDNLGKLGPAEVVLLPVTEINERPLETIINDAISDGAWD